MIEWCYQGDDPEFIENHYKGEETDEEFLKREINNRLIENLGKIGFFGIDSVEKYDNIGDAKDAEYFMSW